ncbi:hypothetical protein FHR90_003415 [Endobacter medicaginis]|uniref:Antitoxin VbhA family protein n=1 Tax=Endobacter medicaginis TaxID=1181271 RepID=A0A850NPZ2_9PROT|nr:antitoxin VbhA family protein [Endobacter medicaginis]MBB3175559.1 hypothetical protein [Endobacter medicaginis]MCX5476935.1 antitoxin VbhA family protein [Endobacter medicaginis]NVN29432.1 antitoxin VbhA family protein [Endobacter medicaginis]
MSAPLASAPLISDDERQRRHKAVEYARNSLRLEGFVLDQDTERLNARYIAGEITSEEHSAAIRRSAGVS